MQLQSGLSAAGSNRYHHQLLQIAVMQRFNAAQHLTKLAEDEQELQRQIKARWRPLARQVVGQWQGLAADAPAAPTTLHTLWEALGRSWAAVDGHGEEQGFRGGAAADNDALLLRCLADELFDLAG